MKNYLDHEVEVQFIDNILVKNQEWQWFVDCIEENFDLNDINAYSEFQTKYSPLRTVFGKLKRIVEISDRDWFFKCGVLEDFYTIARFSLGATTIEECKKAVSTNIGKILFVIIWLTKIENADNATEYIDDLRFLKLNNLFQAIRMESFDEEKDNIIEYLETIAVEGFEVPKKCIADNLLHVSYGVTDGFIEKYKDNLLSPNVFSFQSVQRDQYLTWQEDTLLDMISISVERGGKITPIYTKGNIVVPDYRLWTSKVIEQIKNFFSNANVDFVLESVDFLINGIVPKKEVIDQHCEMLEALLQEKDEFDIYTSSTYKIVALLFSKGQMNIGERDEVVLNLIKDVQKIESISLLLKLREDGFPLSKDQKTSVRQYIADQYKRIELIDNIHDLKTFLCNDDIAKEITQPYYDMIMPKFLLMLDNPRHQLIPLLFYTAMLFLIKLNQTNQSVDKRIVKKDMIELQECWQNEIFEEQCKNLQEVEVKTPIETKDVEELNKAILANPILIARQCMISSLDEMINKMKGISEHPLLYMISRMILSPIYPYGDDTINYDNHDIDMNLKKQIEGIKSQYGYKFLNVLETDQYVTAIHEAYRTNADILIPLFREDEKLYSILEEQLEVKLLPYSKDLQLGHLTQLFPHLEVQIRKLGKMFGIVPFKEKTNEFMKFKDSSSVLRSMLEDIYQELGDFENVPDLLFVYHFMYNGNSLNIRNECLHGRDYLSGNRLVFAYRATLLALYMVVYRIKAIENNIEHERKDDEDTE